jgi:hypothetical protein
MCTCYLCYRCKSAVVKCIASLGTGQQLGDHVSSETIQERAEELEEFSVRPMSSKEILWVCPYIPLSLLLKNSVSSFPRQRIIIGRVVFYVVHVVTRNVDD